LERETAMRLLDQVDVFEFYYNLNNCIGSFEAESEINVLEKLWQLS
jgi:hypothetical protein